MLIFLVYIQSSEFYFLQYSSSCSLSSSHVDLVISLPTCPAHAPVKHLPSSFPHVTAFLSHGLTFSVLAHIANTRTHTSSTHSFLLPSVPYNFYSIRCNKHVGVSAVLSICMCGMCAMCTCVSACTPAHACEDPRSMLSVFVYCSPLCIKTGSLVEPGAPHLARFDGQ